jgi:hypothetical protein
VIDENMAAVAHVVSDAEMGSRLQPHLDTLRAMIPAARPVTPEAQKALESAVLALGALHVVERLYLKPAAVLRALQRLPVDPVDASAIESALTGTRSRRPRCRRRSPQP